MKQPNIGFFTEKNSIETVKSRHKDCDNPRLKKIMDVMIEKIHEDRDAVKPCDLRHHATFLIVKEAPQLPIRLREGGEGFILELNVRFDKHERLLQVTTFHANPPRLKFNGLRVTGAPNTFQKCA